MSEKEEASAHRIVIDVLKLALPPDFVIFSLQPLKKACAEDCVFKVSVNEDG